MIEVAYKKFSKSFYERLKKRRPLHGQIELTHKCAFRCPYCYLKPLQTQPAYQEELSLKNWMSILDSLYKEGCMSITLTGGDPLLRTDFEEIYLYAKRKAFIITVFTNATSLNAKMLAFFKKYTPFSIEITLNSLKESRFDRITGTKGNFKQSVSNIRKAARLKLPLILKTNALKINKDEVIEIKNFAKKILGEKRYKFDTYMIPSLDGGKTPLEYRLSADEIIRLEESDEEIKRAVRESYEDDRMILKDRESLYRCNTWLSSFFINPYGRLGFCQITNKFSTDLRKVPFEKGFYDIFPGLTKKRFTGNTTCRSCELLSECMVCPARSYLEAGDEEAPVAYFCELARARLEQKSRIQ